MNGYQIVSESELFYKQKDFDENDLNLLMTRLSVAASKQNYLIKSLGTVNEYPILVLIPRHFSIAPNILISAGFHGNEVAPCWSILRILESSKVLLKECNVSFLPCVNPTGFKEDTRNNIFDENPNRGFITNDVKLPKKEKIPSAEGKLILDKFKYISKLARDGFLTMHEDRERNGFYLYSTKKKQEEIEQKLLNVGALYFGTYEKELIDKPNKKAIVNNGIARDVSDGSLEDYLEHTGVPICITTETSSKQELYKRIWVNMSLIKTFIEHFSRT